MTYFHLIIHSNLKIAKHNACNIVNSMTTTRNGLLATHFSNRRRIQTSVDDTLNDLSASFLYLLDQPSSHDSRKALKDSEDAIKMHYSKIHLLIDSIDEQLTLKLEHHEQ